MDRKIDRREHPAALSEVLKRDVSGATEDIRLFEDLQLDSTAVLELLMALEDTLGLRGRSGDPPDG